MATKRQFCDSAEFEKTPPGGIGRVGCRATLRVVNGYASHTQAPRAGGCRGQSQTAESASWQIVAFAESRKMPVVSTSAQEPRCATLAADGQRLARGCDRHARAQAGASTPAGARAPRVLFSTEPGWKAGRGRATPAGASRPGRLGKCRWGPLRASRPKARGRLRLRNRPLPWSAEVHLHRPRRQPVGRSSSSLPVAMSSPSSATVCKWSRAPASSVMVTDPSASTSSR